MMNTFNAKERTVDEMMALTLSGLPPHPFLFLGFLPAKGGPRAAELARLRAAERAGLSATLVLYESPHRLAEGLAAMDEALGGARGRVPIVALTANALDPDVADCLAAGMDGHLSKPIEPEALLAAVARYGLANTPT